MLILTDEGPDLDFFSRHHWRKSDYDLTQYCRLPSEVLDASSESELRVQLIELLTVAFREVSTLAVKRRLVQDTDELISYWNAGMVRYMAEPLPIPIPNQDELESSHDPLDDAVQYHFCFPNKRSRRAFLREVEPLGLDVELEDVGKDSWCMLFDRSKKDEDEDLAAKLTELCSKHEGEFDACVVPGDPGELL